MEPEPDGLPPPYDMPLIIREHEERDFLAIHDCIVALQEFERVLYPRLPPGRAMLDRYWESLLARCRDADGHFLVAELDGVVVGFVAVLTREPFTEPDDPPGTYAFINDLVVLPEHRQSGIGRQLLERAETCARDAGATHLRIGVLAANAVAMRLYLGAGFTPQLVILEKPLSP